MAEEYFKGLIEYPYEGIKGEDGPTPVPEQFNRSMYGWFQSVFKISPTRLKRETMTDMFSRMRRGEKVTGMKVMDRKGREITISGPKKGTVAYEKAAVHSRKYVTEAGKPAGMWKRPETYERLAERKVRVEVWKGKEHIVARDIMGRFAVR